MADAQTTGRIPSVIPMTALGAVVAGKTWQLRNGRAGYYVSPTNSAGPPDVLKFQQVDQATETLNPAVAILDGGEVWFDRANGYATYNRVGANRAFFLGTVVGDYPVGSSAAVVDYNTHPAWEIDLARDPFTSVPIGTFAGGGGLFRRGGANLLTLDSTNEAQKYDCLSDDGIITASKGIVKIQVKVKDAGASTHAKFFGGIASGTHATDPSAITEYVLFEIDSNDSKIYALSADGTHSQAKIDTTKTYTVGTRFEAWIDLRNPASVALYVNGVRVLSGTTFDLSSGASNLFLLSWLGKTSSTDTMGVQVDAHKVRTAEQSVSGV